MSFVVMGMDAPENCLKCPMNCKAPDGRILCRRDFQERNPRMRDRCDILPLPEKHGRLIDADALPWENQGKMLTDPGEWGLKASDIEDAPTIVEAEGWRR